MEAITFTDAQLEGGKLIVKIPRESLGVVMGWIRKKKDRPYDLTIAEHREKRSLDANAYYWLLCGKIAKVENVPPVEIYRQHIRDIANYEVICVQDKAVEAFDRYWTSGHLGRFTETRQSKIPECTTVLAYYGSSDFDRAEMARLIDNCVQDCKALDIETMTPEQLSLLKDAWDA